MNLPDCLCVTWLKKVLKSKRNIIIINIDDSILVILKISEIDNIFMIYVFKDVNFLLKEIVFFLIFISDSFLDENFFVLFGVILHLSKRKLTSFHINDSIIIHIVLFGPASANY